MPAARVCGALGRARAAAPPRVRRLHQGHVQATLKKMGLQRHAALEKVVQAPTPAQVRREKEAFLRDLQAAQGEVAAVLEAPAPKGAQERAAPRGDLAPAQLN